MRSARLQPCARVVEVDPAADLQAAGIGCQGRSGFGFVARAQHDHVPALQAVAPVQLGIPGGWAVGDKVRLQPSRLGAQGAADDLLHLSLMQINAGTKHTLS